MSIPELTDSVVPTSVTTGQRLTNQREEWGLSIKDVANSLNLGVDTIQALESDDYEELPGSTFIKGYIRSYARLLKLDVEGLMDSIDLQPERITEIPSSRAALKLKGKTRSRESSRGGGQFLKWFFYLLVLFGLGAFAMTQLPKIGVNGISDLVNSIGSQSGAEKDNNQLVIPGTSDQSTEDSTDQPKGALIRIE